ncbi:hypothetical protein H6P81_011166 [Aristolochia fimbriata]|uniref:Uncharacterized protein n=1 Tax=Aristolochia fimbriata TaxID=158543 RepID=A0AAV7EU87_ARIFI|nr:hypothetical protein H6P81_011166 [Aristolochia fimbriata]
MSMVLTLAGGNVDGFFFGTRTVSTPYWSRLQLMASTSALSGSLNRLEKLPRSVSVICHLSPSTSPSFLLSQFYLKYVAFDQQHLHILLPHTCTTENRSVSRGCARARYEPPVSGMSALRMWASSVSRQSTLVCARRRVSSFRSRWPRRRPHQRSPPKSESFHTSEPKGSKVPLPPLPLPPPARHGPPELVIQLLIQIV